MLKPQNSYRKFQYVIILTLMIVAAVSLHFYINQKMINHALRIKVLTLSKNKKIPIPWSRLTKEDIESFNKKMDKIKTTKKAESKDIVPSKIASSSSAETLAVELNQNMLNIKNLDLSGVEKNIQLADEIIDLEPNSYSAYKAKLISMLVIESKFNKRINEDEFNQTLENMATFEVSASPSMIREAALIEGINQQLIAEENKLNEISLLRDEISMQSSGIEKDTPELDALQKADIDLAVSEQVAAHNLETLQNSVTSGITTPTNINQDIVEIPFLRLMAKSDYVGVVDTAYDYLAQFPYSPNIYYYLIKALELQGKKDEASFALEESGLTAQDQAALELRLEKDNGRDFKRYWENLNF